MNLSQIQQDPDFKKLSPAAQSAVLERVLATDPDFEKLSSSAKDSVKAALTARKQPDAEPWAPFLADKAKSGVAGTLTLPSLLADTLLAPGTALTKLGVAAANLFRNPDNQIQAPRWLQYTEKASPAIQEAMGVQKTPTPKDSSGKPSKAAEYVGAITEFAAGGAIPAAGVIAKAANKGRALASEAAITTASATGSVEGKEIGRDVAEMMGADPSVGGAVGEAAGSFLGLAIPKAVDVAAKGGGKVADFIQDKTGIGGSLTKDAQKEAARVMASRDLGKAIAASVSAEKNLAETVALKEKIPGWNPTLGRATGAPGVIAIEERVSRASPQALADAAEREAQISKSLLDFENKAFPQSKVSPTEATKQRAFQIERALGNRLSATEANISALAAKVDSGIDTSAIGNRLRTLREEARATAAKIKDAKYEGVYQAARDAKITEPVDDVLAKMREIVGEDANVAQVMPQTFSALKEATKRYEANKPAVLLADGNPQPPLTSVPFEAIHSMQKRANADLGAAIVAGDAERAYYIGQVKDVIDAKLAKFEGAEYGDVAAKLRDANEYYKNKYNAVFNEGLGGRMGPRAQTKFGDTTQDADIVRALVFNPGNKKGVEDFFAIYGANPEAANLLKSGIYDMLGAAVVRDGQIQPRAIESFIRQHRQQLDLMPGMSQELQSIDRLNDSLLARRAELQAQQKTFDRSIVAKIANAENVDDVIQSALTSPREMRALTSQAQKTNGASASLARAIADGVASQKDPFKFLVENEKTLRPAMDKLGKDHYENLKTLARAKEISGRIKTPTEVELTKLQDLGEQVIGTSGKGLFSRFMNVENGYMRGGYAAFDIGGRYIYKIKSEEARKLMEAAIYDPDLAKALLQMKKQTPKEAMNSMRNHAYSHGIRVLSTQVENED